MTSILLVEDQPTLRQLLSEVLEFSGYQVTAVADGREALDLLEVGEYFPNLILSDLLMDRLDGDELLQAVRSNWLWREIPFIIMSGQDQITALRLELKREVNGYLEKPFGIADILSTVQKALSKREQGSDQKHSGSERLA